MSDNTRDKDEILHRIDTLKKLLKKLEESDPLNKNSSVDRMTNQAVLEGYYRGLRWVLGDADVVDIIELQDDLSEKVNSEVPGFNFN